MGSVVNALTGGGGKGMGWEAQQASVVSPTTADQANQAYTQSQNGLNQQQALLYALQQQNGLQNQSNVYNQLMGVANGQGPNPAQAQLAQATGANVANQAALMAGQQGSNANAGLMARQIAQQGANTQQQAAGQAATLQANQSLNALGQMGGMANTQAQQQIGATQGLNAMQQSEQQNLLNSINAQNQANVGATSSANSANAGLQGQIAGMQGNMFGNLTSAASAGLGTLGGGGAAAAAPAAANSAGGPAAMATMFAADGGMATQSGMKFGDARTGSGPRSNVGKHFHGLAFASGGKVPALVSPGETYLPPDKVQEVAQTGENPLKAGVRVPGTPKVKGNSYQNDTVPATLEEGGIVIPNSIMQSKNPSVEAAKFIAKILKEKQSKSSKETK